MNTLKRYIHRDCVRLSKNNAININEIQTLFERRPLALRVILSISRREEIRLGAVLLSDWLEEIGAYNRRLTYRRLTKNSHKKCDDVIKGCVQNT